jgi:hypothetical protein
MIAYDKNQVANRGEALSEIWWQGRQWAVTDYGLECRDGTYAIEKGRLLEFGATFSWIQQVGKKTWCDVDDLATAYLVAVAMHGHCLTKAMRANVMEGHDSAVLSKKRRLKETVLAGRLSSVLGALAADFEREIL